MRTYQLHPDLLHNIAAQRLSPAAFKRAFYAALDGEQNAISPFVRVDSGRPPAHEWRALRTAVFARDNYTCQYCGARGVRLECDHIIPVSRGGDHTLDNLTTACYTCNRAKWAHLPGTWAL
jgi:hypothetical protein